MSLKHLFFLILGFVLFSVSCGQPTAPTTPVAIATAVPSTTPTTSPTATPRPLPTITLASESEAATQLQALLLADGLIWTEGTELMIRTENTAVGPLATAEITKGQLDFEGNVYAASTFVTTSLDNSVVLLFYSLAGANEALSAAGATAEASFVRINLNNGRPAAMGAAGLLAELDGSGAWIVNDTLVTSLTASAENSSPGTESHQPLSADLMALDAATVAQLEAAILYPDTNVSRIENGVAYDQNGVVAARQVEHNGEMVWIPAIHEQMIAHSRDVFVAGDPGFSNINVYQYGPWEVRPGKPTTVEITTLDPERTAFFNQSVLEGLHSNPSLQVQDLSDPNRQEITLNQEQVQRIDTINLVITPFNQNQYRDENAIPGITKIDGRGRDHNWYGDSSIKSYWQTAWDETRPNELTIVLALSEAQIKESDWNVLNNIAIALQFLRIPSDVLDETPYAGTWVVSTDDKSYDSYESLLSKNVIYHHDEDGKRVLDSWDNIPALEVKLNQ